MKAVRHVGSLAFVLGLFIVIFAGIPWRVVTVDDPRVPMWLRVAVFGLLAGVLLVLISVALEQRKGKCAAVAVTPDDPGDSVLLLNSDTIPGRTVHEALGIVQGHTVFAIWLGRDLSALIRLVLGGELTEYTEMMGEARALACRRMLAQAADMGADAVINVRYMTTSVVGSAAELLAYGTAVKLSG